MNILRVRHYLPAIACVLCLTVIGCASSFRVAKTQRDLDIDQCTYGAVVPDNIRQRDRQNYITHITVPACLQAKGYSAADSEEDAK